MRIFKWRHLLVSLFFAFSCTSEKVTLENFDRDVWKRDSKACVNERSQFADALIAQKDKLLGLNEIEIVAILGKPDQQEIYKRHEKFYYYFLDPSADCDRQHEGRSRRLVIRFNAVGLSKEVNIE
jgi:hypothetical protein